MKHYKVLILLLIAALMVFSWGNYFNQAAQIEENFSLCYSEAAKKRGEGLYFVALEQYLEAINYKNDEAVWREVADTCREYCDADTSVTAFNASLSALERGMSAAPKCSVVWETAVYICMENGKYQQANKYLLQAENKKVSSENLSEFKTTLTYLFTTSYSSYSNAQEYSGTSFAVELQGLCGRLGSSGETQTSPIYSYVGPSNGDGAALVVDQEGEAFIINRDNISILRIDKEIKSSGVLSEGLMWLETGSGCIYIDGSGNETLSGYEAATNFSGGSAAIKQNGLWGIIDTTGTQLLTPVFTDLKVTPQGGWVGGGCMLVQKDGAYYIYASLEAPVEGFSCDDMDIPTSDGLFAFCRNGLWGYVSKDGTVVIEPEYEKARSFSNGFGAVYKDGSWGFISGNGEEVITPQFDDVGYFTPDRTCFVKIADGAWRLLEFVI